MNTTNNTTTNHTNAAANLTTLTKIVTSEYSLEAQLTTRQNIILNAIIHCIGSISGDAANASRMQSWLGSVGLNSTIEREGTRIYVPFAIEAVDGIIKTVNIRLGRRYTTGYWFVYATCIGQLGLPLTLSNATLSNVRNDIPLDIKPA